jgi:hypothetical protein
MEADYSSGAAERTEEERPPAAAEEVRGEEKIGLIWKEVWVVDGS